MLRVIIKKGGKDLKFLVKEDEKYRRIIWELNYDE